MKSKRLFIFGALIIFGLIAVIVYLVIRVLLLFDTSNYSAVERTFSVLLIIAEAFILVHATGYMMNILRSGRAKKTLPPKVPIDKEPSVAVLVAARHEPKNVLENTFITLRNINYKNKEIYFLDDSSEDKYKKEAEELSKDYDLRLFRRKDRHGAKAGIVNDCLKGLNHKYVAVFDADQNPLPDFLQAVIPLLEADAKLAFVQTPQFYTNIEESRVARGSAFQQAVFYEYICEGKNSGDAMFCCGTNVVFRTEALKEVGGLDESTVTEDFATSIKLHTSGWRSLYFGHVHAFGMGPEDLGGYFKQQFRWATGTISVLRKVLFKLLTKPSSLKFWQWWEYLLSGSYYLIGIAFFFMILCPILYVFLRIPSFFANPEIYVLSFVPYFLLSIAVFYTLLGERNYKARDLFCGQVLGACTFTVYIRAAIYAILGIGATFGITQKGKTTALPLIKLWPQMSFILLDFVAIVWGINRFIYEMEPAILINSGWLAYHGIILCGIFYFNQGELSKTACKSLAKELKSEFRVVNDILDIESLSNAAWRLCLGVFLTQEASVGSLVMCKVWMPDKEEIIFEARVINCDKNPSAQGYRATVGVSVILEEDREKLRKVVV